MGEHAQKRFGTSNRADLFYTNQALAHLNPRMREFIARRKIGLHRHCRTDGACDSSLQTGLSGFIQVLDDNTLAYPDFRGHGVFASVATSSRIYGSACSLWIISRARWACTSTGQPLLSLGMTS